MSYQRNNQKTNGPGPIPNRWLYCPRKSDTIIAERFLAFKTPLSSAYNDQMPQECLFPPKMMFDYCQTLKLKLGLWIDLTNTKRFYDRKVVEEHGAQYVKLQCRGHGETPSKEQTHSFIEIIDNFINERPFDVIGIHCTHGFNRTGFLIVSYLVECLDCSVAAALTMFTNARPPGIYKQDYINELFRRYENEEDALPAPELPAWCLEYDDSDGNSSVHHAQKRVHSDATDNEYFKNDDENDVVEDGNEDLNNDDRNVANGEAASSTNGRVPRKKRRREMFIKDAKFMAGVPGVVLVTDHALLSKLQTMVQEMCNWEKNGFPGAQPVSMDMENINRLRERPYLVSWKADGTRYMMLIKDRDEVYFFDRNFSCFQVENLTFLRAGHLNEHLTNTLLDGEMVLDKLNGQITPRYLIYDIVKISGQDIGRESFRCRLRCIKKEIIDPRYQGIEKGLIDRPSEPFSLRFKDFWDIRQSASLLGEKFAKTLLHEPDGLIFQPVDQPYIGGCCQDVFKWKPHELNSVDFRLKITVESGIGILNKKIGLLYVGGQDQEFGRIKITKAIKELDNKIIECTLNNTGEWEFMRERTDKTMPNSYNTAVSVLGSIRNPVTKEKLLNFIERYGYRDDHHKMPPPSTNHVQRSGANHPHHLHQPQQQHLHHQQQHHHQQQLQYQQQQVSQLRKDQQQHSQQQQQHHRQH